MKVRRITQVIVVIVIFLLTPARGQKGWEKKPYNEWTFAEVLGILSDSPWAQTASETDHTAYNLPGVSYSATIRLRSALPIRQALVRERQLEVNYDKLSNEDKRRFDAETREFLECSNCSKYYIVSLVSYLPAGSPRRSSGGVILEGSYGVDIAGPLRNLTFNDLQPYVHLSNDKGERRALVAYTPTKRGEVMFIFPRLDEQGRPLLNVGHKKLYFEIDRQVFKNMVGPLKKFTFEVRKLVRDDQVVF